MDLQTPTIDDYRISKKEEYEALAFIKQFIVVDAVDYFESNKIYFGRRKNDIVKPRKVISNLRKVAHYKAGEPGNPVGEADYILYEGYDDSEDNWPPTTFGFLITKSHADSGWIFLEAGWINPLKKGPPVINMLKKTKHISLPTPLKEGTTIDFNISKQEEQQAIQFIRTHILVGPLEKVRKFLKKTEVEHYGLLHRITFSARVDGTWHGYRISRNPKGGILIVCLTDNQFKRWVIKEGKHSNYQKEVSVPLLSRREKDEAFHILKLLIVPQAVNERNMYLILIEVPRVTVEDTLKNLKKKSDTGNLVTYESRMSGVVFHFFIEKKSNDFIMDNFGKPMVYIGYLTAMGFENRFTVHPKKSIIPESQSDKPLPPVTKIEELRVVGLLKKHYSKEFPEIGKYLKKQSIWQSTIPEVMTDEIHYEYNDGKQRAIFAIFRTKAGLWVKMVPEGEKNARDNIHINILSETLTDAFEKPEIAAINRKEEAWGLTFIKRGLVPLAVKIANEWVTPKSDTWCRYKTVTVEEVLKSLRKMKHEKKGPSEYIEFGYNGGEDRIPLKFWLKKAVSPFVDRGEKMVLHAGFEKPMTQIHFNYVVQFYEDGKAKLLQEDKTSVEDNLFLNKRDIHQAIDFIKKEIVPVVVQDYDKNKIRADDKITVEELTRNLKITAIHGSTVYLHSIIKGRDFQFLILKKKTTYVDIEKGKVLKSQWKLAAGYMLPFGIDDKYKPSLNWFLIDKLKQTPIKGKDSHLIFETEDPILSRKEEDYVLEVIKKRLLPEDLEIFNFRMNGTINKFITLEQAIKMLHKEARAMYTIIEPNGNPSMCYWITKNLNGTISINYEEDRTRRRYEFIVNM